MTILTLGWRLTLFRRRVVIRVVFVWLLSEQLISIAQSYLLIRDLYRLMFCIEISIKRIKDLCLCWNIKWHVFWKYTNPGKSAPNDCSSSGISYFYHVPIPDGNEFPLCHASRPALRGPTLLSNGHKGLPEGKATGTYSWPLAFL